MCVRVRVRVCVPVRVRVRVRVHVHISCSLGGSRLVSPHVQRSRVGYGEGVQH